MIEQHKTIKKLEVAKLPAMDKRFTALPSAQQAMIYFVSASRSRVPSSVITACLAEGKIRDSNGSSYRPQIVELELQQLAKQGFIEFRDQMPAPGPYAFHVMKMAAERGVITMLLNVLERVSDKPLGLGPEAQMPARRARRMMWWALWRRDTVLFNVLADRYDREYFDTKGSPFHPLALWFAYPFQAQKAFHFIPFIK